MTEEEQLEEGFHWCNLHHGLKWHKWVELPVGSYYYDGATEHKFMCTQCLKNLEREFATEDEDVC